MLGAIAPRAAADEAQSGVQLVGRWCVTCHSVGRALDPPNLALPFMAIAEQGGRDGPWLRDWLRAPHPALPEISRSEKETVAITSYLNSLVLQKGN